MAVAVCKENDQQPEPPVEVEGVVKEVKEEAHEPKEYVLVVIKTTVSKKT